MQLAMENPVAAKSIRAGDMEFLWSFAADELHATLRAPARGWLALGFNDREGLSGTNLIMAAVHPPHTEISNRTVVTPGDHRAISSVGGKSHIRLIAGSETAQATEVTIAVTLKAGDRFHFDLAPGREIYLLLAWSRGKDFKHHSAFRTTVRVRL